MHNFLMAVEKTTTLLVFSYKRKISVGHENRLPSKDRVSGSKTKERELKKDLFYQII